MDYAESCDLRSIMRNRNIAEYQKPCEDKLHYKAFNSPEWQSIAKQLHERCKREKVESNKSPQQCKNKMAKLTKKYKTVKDKPRTTGYGKGGDDELHKKTKHESDLIPTEGTLTI